MPKPKRDPVREERIHEQIIVDAYGPGEQAMGWYYYLEDKIRFPFQASASGPHQQYAHHWIARWPRHPNEENAKWLSAGLFLPWSFSMYMRGP